MNCWDEASWIIYLLLLSCLLITQTQAASFWTSFRRTKRGYLSRSGICPDPFRNMNRKDTRLNFYGIGYLLPGDEEPDCRLNECMDDGECDGSKKCCTNYCGASVCTEAMREPHPCELFTCPRRKVCKIQRVRCIDPFCPDLLAVTRPICVPGGPVYEMAKKSRIPHPETPLERYQEYERRKNILARPDLAVQYEPKEPYYKSPSYSSHDVFSF